jgi:hypothetical protein
VTILRPMRLHRPTGPIPGTHLIRAIDTYAMAVMRDQADAAATHASDESDYEAKSYAQGVRDLLAWLEGGAASTTLQRILTIEPGSVRAAP